MCYRALRTTLLSLFGFLWLSNLQAQSLQQSSQFQNIFEANQRLGRGVNLGNFLEVPRSENWGVPIELKHLQLIKQAGFQSIRIPTKWSDYAGQNPPYLIEESFAKRVDTFIDEAEKVGINVVLNIHHYYDLDKDPLGHKDRFAALWTQIANRYKARGAYLYFELHNEPHEQLSEHWNEVLLVGLAAIRQSNPIRPVIVGPAHWNGIWALPKLQLPADPNLIVTVHMYNPHEFTHQGATWSNPEVREIRDRTFGKPEEIEKVVKELENAAKWGRDHQRPIYLGEFGAYQKAPQASRIVWTQTIARQAERLGMSWSYWEFAAGFGVYDLSSQHWRKDLLGALLPESPAGVIK
jgi:endoglucanase